MMHPHRVGQRYKHKVKKLISEVIRLCGGTDFGTVNGDTSVGH